MDQQEIDRRHSYHAPSAETADIHGEWRKHFRWLAEHIEGIPGGDSREKSLAHTAIEEASFWVHAHIARNLS